MRIRNVTTTADITTTNTVEIAYTIVEGCFAPLTTRSTTYPTTISGNAATHSQNPVSTSTGLIGSVVVGCG